MMGMNMIIMYGPQIVMRSGLKYSEYTITEEFGLKVTMIMCVFYAIASVIANCMIGEFGRRYIMLVVTPFIAFYLGTVALAFKLSFYSLDDEMQSFGGFYFFMAMCTTVLLYGIGFF